MCRLVLAPRFPETHALFGDWTVHAQSLPLFIAGYAIAGNAGFRQRIRALRRSTLAIALACITIELTITAGGRDRNRRVSGNRGSVRGEAGGPRTHQTKQNNTNH